MFLYMYPYNDKILYIFKLNLIHKLVHKQIVMFELE